MENWSPTKAVRRDLKCVISLCGRGGSGKTFSALTLATGMSRVLGQRIAVIDTENGRAKHYADSFDFDHVPFDPPFDPLRYLDAIRFCQSKRYGVVIVDSASQWWEGEGGVLDMHAKEVERRMERAVKNGQRNPREESFSIIAWSVAKAPYKRLVQELGRCGTNVILCFRAAQKLEVEKGQNPKKAGWAPVCGPDEIHASTLACLLDPDAQGVPVWITRDTEEQRVVKLTASPFKWLEKMTTPFDEAVGERIARWCQGVDADLQKRIADASSVQELDAMVEELRHVDDKDRFRRLWQARKLELQRERDGGERKVSVDRPVDEQPHFERIPGVDIE